MFFKILLQLSLIRCGRLTGVFLVNLGIILKRCELFSDAGKSTIGGQMMYLTGMVDKRTLEKYEREAKEKNRETWYLSWCMDTNQEGERS